MREVRFVIIALLMFCITAGNVDESFRGRVDMQQYFNKFFFSECNYTNC